MDLITLAIAGSCLLIGLAAGSLLTKTLSPQQKKRRELEELVRRKELELKLYQQDVSEHFIKTSDLIREMSRSYQEINEHLATSALLLTTPDISSKVQAASQIDFSARSKGKLLSSATAEPPKDYAPSVPGGVLNEHYGLASDEGDERAFTRGLSVSPSDSLSGNDDDDDPTYKVG